MDMDDLAGTLKIKRESLYQRIYYGKLEIPHMKNGKKYLFKQKMWLNTYKVSLRELPLY